MMTFEELPQRVEFAVPHGEHQIVIGQGFSDGFHGGRAVFNHVWKRMRMNFGGVGDHGGRKTCGCRNKLGRTSKVTGKAQPSPERSSETDPIGCSLSPSGLAHLP